MTHRPPPSLVPALCAALLLAGGARPQDEPSGGSGPPAASAADDEDRDEDEAPTLAEALAERRHLPGLLDVYLDDDENRVAWLLPAPDARGHVGEYLYVEALASGLGSNPIGLDRGQLGRTRVVAIRRHGERVLVEETNTRFRALSTNADEVRATRASFAPSVLWAEDTIAIGDDGRALVDVTGFLLRDAHGVVSRLEAAGQGSFELDTERSLVDLDRCLAFARNLELEARLTYTSDDPGPLVRSVAATPEAFTLVQHHSLVALPEAGYTPRRHDPRAGAFSIGFHDYAAPLDRPIDVRWARRHRLRKTHPGPEPSPVVEPIVYYVDRGAPEPVRSALVEGARWWAEAFEAAGLRDAFRVELLPEDAHPLDVRYDVIQWVHRRTRGWSYGQSVTDPRTGEILKGHVLLGSLRVRQDRLLFEGLLGTDETGSGEQDDPIELALARIRQLAAHEVGHTLGFAHNFAASAWTERASVMDYPPPRVRVRADGTLDVSDAYAVGLGAWDLVAARWLYGEHEEAARDAILREARERGLVFLSDADARPEGASVAAASLWDDGPDPVAALREALAVRRVALEGFDETRVHPGRPLAHLQEVLAPVYLHHRYQLEATVKLIGGWDYRHALADDGDGTPPARVVPAATQRSALAVVLETLAPERLDLPERLLARLLPRPPGEGEDRELFNSASAPAFDRVSAARAAVDLTLGHLLQPARCARLVDLGSRLEGAPTLREVLDALVGRALAPVDAPRLAPIADVVCERVVVRLIELAEASGAAPAVRAEASAALTRLRGRLPARGTDEPTRAWLARRIDAHLSRPRPDTSPPPRAPDPPPGSPIGAVPGWGACSHPPR